MFERKLLKNIDWVFVGLVGALLLCSLFVLTSASSNVVDNQPFYYLKKQILWMLMGLFVVFLLMMVDYKNLNRLIKPMYIFMIILLIGVLFMPEQKGGHRWYDLGFMDFQPSEFAKIITIVCFAAFLSAKQSVIDKWSTFFLCFAVVGAPMLLVFVEPDLGTSLVFGAILIAMMWVGGIPRKRMIGFLLIIAGIVIFVFVDLGVATGGFKYMATELPIPLPMKTYQLMRLVIFINPDMDPLNTGYHIIQSQVAIGSGGLFGKGFGQGSQVQGNFLPEHHTDFIFSVVGEEFGLVGAFVLLGIYLMILMRGVRIAFESADLFGTLIVVGVVVMFAFQIFVNVGMTIGIMPVTGLPLPLLSYGGTSMLMNMTALGMIITINMRKQRILF